MPWSDGLSFDAGYHGFTPESKEERAPHFRFLDDLTKYSGFIHSFDCATWAQRRQVVSEHFQSPGVTLDAITTPSLSDFHVPESWAYVNFGEATEVDYCVAQIAQPWLSDPLAVVTNEITNMIKEVVTVKARSSIVALTWSSLLQNMSLQFFSPPQLRKHLALYWAIWHPNVNFVHKPTFDPLASKAILVASMALIGACVSPDEVDRDNAKTWFNCIEELVFTDGHLLDDAVFTIDCGSDIAGSAKQKIQALQAAYMVCLFQNWEGSDQSKRRIRRHRYSTVIGVARDISINKARHRDYAQHGIHCFNWREFVLREELIRVFIWIFLLDTAFVIFNNLPPRMVIKEMKMDMACAESCFQAATSHECYAQIQADRWRHQGWQRAREFCSAVETLCRDSDKIQHEHLVALADQGPLNLFATTSALHSLIFHYQNSFGSQGQLVPVRNAIKHWKQTWQIYSVRFSTDSRHATVVTAGEDLACKDMWKRIGFVRHASEYWLLASLMLDKISAAATKPKSPEFVSRAMTDHASTSIVIDPGGGTEGFEPVLERYDETSMRQVNELLADFQKMYIALE
ncbi:hypothetical protein LTR72_008659 [Exophiala xenobiotica]|nr:hypothetical protein LTR72_008659 [Exophiala xenobiotica]KAK5253030.1 hypothetical protein LTS06_002488 [Exophiala xenobiotica]KAK5319615.1 hypothetical protein LTR93_007535 [Exophiala xenobiotica]KAK5357046.1 hypothetical protein LTR61_000782 [Exophiala xenobiotica]KAK5377200.1 hypothetical protein LTR11_004865 [Exophiala xenobiotica]